MAEMDSKEIAMVSNDPDVDVGKVTATNDIVIDDGVRRALKSRHLQMIALGGYDHPHSTPLPIPLCNRA